MYKSYGRLCTFLGLDPYLDGKVVEEETNGVNAFVTMNVRLYLVIGEVVQIERYTLINVEGHWLVDGQEILHEGRIEKTV